MSEVGIFNNYNLLVSNLDKDKNGVMNELSISDSLKTKIDLDRNGEISNGEAIKALKAEIVEINGDRIAENKGFKLYSLGTNQLKDLNTMAKEDKVEVSGGNVEKLTGEKLEGKINEYGKAIKQMKMSLGTMEEAVRGSRDSISQGLATTIKSSLENVNNTLYLDESVKAHKAAYEILKKTMEIVEAQTSNLPSPKNEIVLVDESISRAKGNLDKINASEQKPGDVNKKLNSLSVGEAKQVNGKALKFGGYGSGAGALVGGVVGYIYAGKTAKSALIGAGVGTAVVGGISSFVGLKIDKHHGEKAKELKKLGEEASKYNAKDQEKDLSGISTETYKALLLARESHDIDDSKISVNNIREIGQKAKAIEDKSAKILKAYEMK